MILIKMFKANEGDAFLVSLGDDNQYNIMIDMGLDTTYYDYIKPELEKLKKMKRKLDLLVITHVDEDHILGGLEFIKENGQNGDVIEIGEVWHNTYRHLQFDVEKSVKLSQKQLNKVEEIIESNPPRKSSENGASDISIEQGISFGGYILQNGYKWNECFEDEAVTCDVKEGYVDFNSDIKIKILSPDEKKLKALAKKWIEDLDTIYDVNEISNEAFWDDAFEYYMQYLKPDDSEILDISDEQVTEEKINEWSLIKEYDSSQTNGSSISFIIEYDAKKLLFLGDSHSNIIYNKLVDLKSKGYELSFDAVKISHHGSNKNISKKFIDLIEGKRFLISTDGNKHEHPDMEALAKIITNNQKSKKEIIFNYEIEKIKPLCNAKLEEKYNYVIKFLTDDELIKIE